MKQITTGDIFLVALLVLETDWIIIDNVEVDRKRNTFILSIPNKPYEDVDRVFKGYKRITFKLTHGTMRTY
ncbi:hypothetical protein LLY41_14355 [Cytobacillus firmus]|uniref:hypothetical protein n=1 Tax=Cytobacillus firmus TaxID=1399 RepID=UPI002187971C|nr:hypothetical protein [Cytobacillus firmus]URM31600.1 hypothetical protein LLY41_14355 [Cytobacillus firmus]